MNTDIRSTATATLAEEAAAALQAITDQAKTVNLSRVAELSDGVDEDHVAAHIRGLVAVSMAHLSADAPAITRDNADHWQEWALGVADRVVQTVPAA